MRIIRKTAGPSRSSRSHILGSLTLMLLSVLVISGLSIAELQVPPIPKQELPLPKTDYKIGPNDLLEILVLELPEFHQIVRVSEDGTISLALIGKVDVAGLTAQELETKLAAIFNQKITNVAHVTVAIKEFQKLAVLGAVVKPGMYELSGPVTLIQMIANAGGLTPQALNQIIIYRQTEEGKKSTILVSLDDLVRSTNTEVNLSLQPKDVVFIPVDQTLNVYVYGEVKNPGIVSFLSSKRITVLQAVTQAGGPTEWASPARVKIKRKDKETGKEIQILANLKAMIRGKAKDIVLEEGDIVIVP